MKLSDFHPLTGAEARLVDWLQSGERRFCEISSGVPAAPGDAVTLRATFVRYLALGGCDACRLPATGLRLRGAWIEGDEDKSGETRGLDLEGATLAHDLALLACHIPDDIILRSARLKNLFLNDSQLGAGLNGDRLHAEGGVFLRGAAVAGKVRLLGARVGGDLDCDGATLNGTPVALQCNGAQVRGGFFLREDAQVKGAIDLTAASFEAISDDPDCWPEVLELDRCRYGAFLGQAPTDANSRLDWLKRIPCDPGEFRPDPYEHCAKVLREMGHSADARDILIAKERLQRAARVTRLKLNGQTARSRLVVLTDWILGKTTRYGRQPLVAALYLLWFWAVGTGVFSVAGHVGHIKPNLPQIQVHAAWVECAEWGPRRRGDEPTQVICFRNQPEGISYPAFNPVIYAADTLFPVASFEMQSYWIPDDSQPFGRFARIYLWLHIFAGWALTLLAVAGFSGLIKTDSKS